MTKTDEKRLDTFLHKCLRKILKVHWPMRVSNDAIFLPSALKMLFKETFRDPNVAVSPKNHPFSTWSCKPPELNIQRFEQVFLERKF